MYVFISLVYKQTCYLFQYPSKVVTETADAKMKIGVIKDDDKEILLFIAHVNLKTKEFQKHEYFHTNYTWVPSKSDHSKSDYSKFISGGYHTRLKFSHRYYWAISYSSTTLCTCLLLVTSTCLWSKRQVTRGFWNPS